LPGISIRSESDHNACASRNLSDQLLGTLRNLLTQRKREALQQGLGESVSVVFHQNGHYMSQNTIRNIYGRILKKSGMRHMRPHDVRHTYASLLLSNGESPVYVKEQLGHSSIQMTVDIRGHLIPGSNRGAVNRLDTAQPDRNPATCQTQTAATHSGYGCFKQLVPKAGLEPARVSPLPPQDSVSTKFHHFGKIISGPVRPVSARPGPPERCVRLAPSAPPGPWRLS